MRINKWSTTAVCCGTLLAAGALVAPGASSAQVNGSSAYGIALSGGGQEVIPPSPTVQSPDGKNQTTGGEIPDNPLLSGGALTLSAGNDKASVKVTDLTIGGVLDQLPQEVKDGLTQLQASCDGIGQLPVDEVTDQLDSVLGQLPVPLPPTPTADDLTEFCNGLFDGDVASLAEVDAVQVSCSGDRGTVTLTGASSVLTSELPIDGDVEPNTALLPDNPLLDITLNRQSRNSDGSFTVDGVVVNLADGQGELVLASTTCAEVAADRGDRPPTAPRPTPVPRNVPVTG